jgi:DNA-binding transcriptional MocR family regulator
MLLQSPWRPYLADLPGSPADRLITALADDILEGRLEAGARLPAHRDLAWSLKIGVGTVTKAYAVLERRGLTRSVKGRGTFVALVQAHKPAGIDLSFNQPPAMLSDRLLRRTLSSIAKTVDPGLFTHYPPPLGHDEHRRLMTHWLNDLGMPAEAERVVLTSGAQQAMAVAFSVALKPGGTIFCEALTYPGVLTLARFAGYRVVGVAMDHEGMLPAALEEALANRPNGVRSSLVYIMPTMQNPTTATMSAARRHEIAEICRRHAITVVEDDVYSLVPLPGRPPIATLLPERTFYVNSLSKTVSPGLRIGSLVVPPGQMERSAAALRATLLAVSPLSCAVMERWMVEGTADTLRAAIRMEADRRTTLARSILGSAMRRSEIAGFHIFLPMVRAEAERVAAEAASFGVAVTTPRAIAADRNSEESGLRLCLGAPSLPDLRAGLSRVASLLAERKPLGSLAGLPISA